MRRRWLTQLRWGAVLLVAGLVSACGTDDGSPTTDYVVTGVVSDALSGDRVSGATVRFTSDTLYTEETRTGGDGEYTLRVESDVPFGQVRVEKAGYLPAEATVYFDSTPRRLDIKVREGSLDGGV